MYYVDLYLIYVSSYFLAKLQSKGYKIKYESVTKALIIHNVYSLLILNLIHYFNVIA